MADPRANELEFHDELPLRRISVAENHVHSPEIADKALQLEPVDGEFGAAAQSPTAEASWPGIIPRLPASASVVVVRWGAAAWSPLEYISPNVRQWGYEAEEFLSGQRIFESIIHEQDRKPADEPPHWARIGDSILSDRALYRIVTRTGEWRWVLDVSVAETGKSGEVRTAHGFLLDLTEQVRSGAETEMRARELTYRDERLQRLLAREKRQTRLLAAIGDIQSQLIAGENPLAVFEVLLDAFVRLTDSEYGFVGEWLHDDQGAPYLRTCAISNKAWNDYTRRLFEEQQATLEFHNLQTLIGAVLRDGRPVVSNDPATDARRGGLPLGHPALHSFLGLPLSHGTELVGIVGIANRAGGYSDDLVEFLRPLMHTGGHMIAAARLDARRREAEAVIQRRERILAAVRFAAHRLLRDADWRSCVPDILEQLAKATGSSRAYLFENHYDGQQRLLTSQTAEWVAEGVIPQIGNPQLQDVPWVEAGLERWLSKMARGEAVWGRVAELGAAERTLLEPQGIVSPAAVPVFAFGHFWGLIGFDDCIEPRLWSTSELDALNAAADVLGAAVERKRSEELLHQRSAELAHVVRLATTGEMVAEITHEIRQPLFSIMNFAQAATREMAKPGGGNKADVAQGLHRIQQSVARADSILERTASFIVPGEESRHVTDVKGLVKESLEMLEWLARRLDIRVTFEPLVGEAHVQADKVQLQQVVVNLLKNAYESLQHLEMERRAVHIRIRSSDSFVEIQVEDNGVGIEPDKLPSIFTPFFTTKPNGMGMGLVVCRAIVESHGGRIQVASTPGRGATFSVTIPQVR